MAIMPGEPNSRFIKDINHHQYYSHHQP